MRKQDDDADDDDRHRHKRRRTDVDLKEVTTNTHDDDELRTELSANKQARKRAEEIQAEVNDNKRRKNIEAHQKNVIFEIPSTEVIRNDEMTDEQTNNSLFNGKE
eukprot:16106927-Heterocapsa_arctica.AAC.1